MTDQNRGTMKFDGADSPIAVALSGILILGFITFLIIWAMQTAYTI